jgi:curved DNA-binding protein
VEYKDYYAILGVPKAASSDEIKHAYRRLARKYHPDVSKEKNAEEQFKNLQEAYEVLKDPKKREAYDQLGSNWQAGQEFRPPPGWQGRTQFYTGGDEQEFAEGEFGDFSDFFTNLFGGGGAGAFRGRRAHAFKQRGPDERAIIQITLSEAFHGTTKTFQLQRESMSASGQPEIKTHTVKVTIPSGITQDQSLRLAQQGGSGLGGGPAGDLYLTVHIEPHPIFSLQGKDIYLTLPITPWESALGATIQVPTLDGKIALKLAKGAQGGQKLRLKGKGMPDRAHPGDQYVILQIQTPPAETETTKALYEKMAHEMKFNPRAHLEREASS